MLNREFSFSLWLGTNQAHSYLSLLGPHLVWVPYQPTSFLFSLGLSYSMASSTCENALKQLPLLGYSFSVLPSLPPALTFKHY